MPASCVGHESFQASKDAARSQKCKINKNNDAVKASIVSTAASLSETAGKHRGRLSMDDEDQNRNFSGNAGTAPVRKTAIICTIPDQASFNISNHILEIGEWKEVPLPSQEMMDRALELYPITDPETDYFDPAASAGNEILNESGNPENGSSGTGAGSGENDAVKNPGYPDVVRPPENESNRFTKIYEQGDLRLFFLDGRHVFQDRLDRRLDYLGFPADRIIFPSKHKSKTEICALTVHSTGNVSKAVLGGSSVSLSVPDPVLLEKILNGLKSGNEETGLGYDVTLEVTHHGPTDLKIPSLFAEIGSAEKEWTNPTAGKIVAEAVMSIRDLPEICGNVPEDHDAGGCTDEKESPAVAVGFGGGHYAERQTKHLLAGKIRFGHIFPKHHMEFLTEDLIREAFEKSGATVAYFDKKSIRGDDRRRVMAIVQEAGIPVLTDRDFKDRNETDDE